MKIRRFLGSLVLVFSLMMGIVGICPVEAEAASSYTLLTGESIEVTVFGSTVKSYSSSKKSVIKLKKTGSNKVKVTAKKAGKSKVVIRGKNGGKLSYNFTVKKPKFKWTLKSYAFDANYDVYSFQIVNKSGIYISSMKAKYHLYDASGTEIESSDLTLNKMPPGKSAIYVLKHYNSSGTPLGDNARLSGFYTARSFNEFKYKYTNVSGKIKVTKGESTITIKNKTKKSVEAVVNILYYDASGNIIDGSNSSAFLTSKGVQTLNLYPPRNMDHYTATVRAVSYKYVG